MRDIRNLFLAVILLTFVGGVGEYRVAIVPLFRGDEVALGTCDKLQEVVAGCRRRRGSVGAAEVEDRSQPDAGRGEGRSSSVVGLDGAAGDQRIGSLGQGIGHQKFQFSGFVAPAGQPQQIIPLHVKGRTSQRFGQAVQLFNRCWSSSVASSWEFDLRLWRIRVIEVVSKPQIRPEGKASRELKAERTRKVREHFNSRNNTEVQP